MPLTNRPARRTARPSTSKLRRAFFEALEGRQMMAVDILLSGANLQVNDTGATANELVLNFDGANYNLQGAAGEVFTVDPALIGATGNGTNTASIPAAAFTGSIAFSLGAGADSLVIDTTNNINRSIAANGGGDVGDAISVTGSGSLTNGATFQDAALTLSAPISGVVSGNVGQVNVNSPASIQDGIDAAAAGATITVGDGNYTENVRIAKKLKLVSVNGRSATTITGIGGSGVFGSVQVVGPTSGVQIGDTNQGFKIIGFDNNLPGQENAAVYFQSGPHTNTVVRGNEIVANGDLAFLTEFASVINGMTVDGNIFSGTTYTGTPAGSGSSQQFTLPNVPRQLVVISGGSGGGNTSNVTFTNNEIIGNAGALNGMGQEQGNSLVTIDSNGSTITGNTFNGTTTRGGSFVLRARGPNRDISGNTFESDGISDSVGYVFVSGPGQTPEQVAAANDFEGGVTVPGVGVVSSLQGAIDAAAPGSTIQIPAGTYAENLTINKNLTLEFAAGVVLAPASGNAITVTAGTTNLTGSDVDTGMFGTVVNSGATLAGTAGVSGPVTILNGGNHSPGLSPAVQNTGDYTQAGTLTIEVVNPATPPVAGTTHDQVNVTGTVTLTGALSVNLTGAGAIPTGTTLVIINNDLSDAVTGTFTSLANGSLLTSGIQSFRIFYNGGDGNDVVLVAVPAAAPAVVYVDDDYATLAPGVDPDGVGPATAIGYDAFPTIQAGVTAVAANGTVNVASGAYNEDVGGKAGISLLGAGAATTTIVGQLGGANETVLVSPGETVRGFTITRVTGIGENNIGVTLTTGGTGMVLADNVISGNRTGVYANGGSSVATISGNVIENNRTGILFPDAAYGDYVITENFIRNNQTFGIILQPAVTTLGAGFRINGNSLTGNFASQLENNTAVAVNASTNWFGAIDPPVFNGSVNTLIGADPNFTYPGPAVPPGSPFPFTLSGTGAALIDFTPSLNTGVDSNAAAPGFQSDYLALTVHTAGNQTPPVPARIQEAVIAANAGGVVTIQPGTYAELAGVDSTGAGDSVTLTPGTGPALVTIVGGLLVDSDDTLAYEIGGTTAGTQYDQFAVSGGIALGNAALSLTSINSFVPVAGQSFRLINNTGAGAVTGTFAGLAEGAVLPNFLGSGLPAVITYVGGDGNDVVINVGANPVITSANSASVNENTTTAIDVNATDSDVPAQTLTYAISGGADAGLFTIDPATGVVTFNAAPDYEAPADSDANNVYNFDVTVTDGAGGSATQSIAITVLPVNDNNPVVSSANAASVNENTTAAIGVNATDADLPAQTLTYAISGTDAALFTIDSATGVVTFNAAPDYEAPADAGADNVYNFDVTVTDGAGGSTTQSIAITVLPLNDNNPVITSAAAASVNENQTAAIDVNATDADLPAQTLTYAISGTDAALFTIDPATGVVTFNTAPDFEAPADAGADNVYNFTVTVTDGAGGSTTQAIAITVLPLNDNNPVFTSPATVSVPENTTAVQQVTATDADRPAQTITYSITGGADAALFTINSTTGQLSFVSPRDFETPTDFNMDNEYRVRVTASDGAGGTTEQLIMVTVTDTTELDFGDAPATYGTTLAGDGARHLAGSLRLGSAIDVEADGQPSANAQGDDANTSDDEDGVTLPATLLTRVGATVTVNASAAGRLDAWIDYNRNGVFDASERIASNLAVVAGANTLSFEVPGDALTGQTFARFRLSSAGNLAPTGLAADGEVEDYSVNIQGPAASSAVIVDDPENPGSSLLLINGSQSSDAIVVFPAYDRPGYMNVLVAPFGGISQFQTSAVQRIAVFGNQGDDAITIDPFFTIPTTLRGNAGNDTILGGSGRDTIYGGLGIDTLLGRKGDDIVSGDAGIDFLYGNMGNDILLGGEGDDFLYGGQGRDVLIGSLGRDTLFGLEEDDILIGNRVAQEGDLAALNAIRNQWVANATFESRVATLSTQLNSTTVIDDGIADYLYGNTGRDWSLDFSLRDYFFDFTATGSNRDRKN